jgi:hypothetical protein
VQGRCVKVQYAFSFKDQGWGNKIGAVFAVLWRGMDVVARNQLGHICEHEWTENSGVVGPTEDVLALYQPGDELGIAYRCGGGGGHEIYIRDLVVDFSCDGPAFQVPNTDITNEDLVVDFSCDGLALQVLDTDITNEIDFGVRLKHLAISLILQLHSLSLTRSSECHSRIICLRCK